MAITSISARVNLSTGKLDLIFVNGTPAITAGTIRVTAPDGQYYYFGGTITNFAAGTGTVTVGASTTTAYVPTITLPLDINGAVQFGLYKVDYNYTAGSLLSYSGVLSTSGFTFAECVIPVPTPNASVDCVNAVAIFSDITGSGYVINSATPTISRTLTVQKINGLPSATTPSLTGWTAWTYTSPSPSTTLADTGAVLGYPYLYSGVDTGNYKVTVAITLSWNFGTYTLYSTSTKIANFNVTCDQNTCGLFCAINNLKLQIEVLPEDSARYQVLFDKWIKVDLYRGLFLEAYRCNSDDVKASALNTIKSTLGYTDNCNPSSDFQIVPYKLCDCDEYVEVPNAWTSTTAPSGYTYQLYDRAIDANYEYHYIGIGVWGRTAINTTPF